MYFLLRVYLAFLARIIVKIKKPYIIGVTGTVGKTTVSRFLIQSLQSEFGAESVHYSQYNYNGEYGLPLAIIGAKSGGKNIFLWIKIFFVAIFRLFQKYPRFLVLEYGIDHVGEMDFLLSIAIPNIAIVTPISPNHIEQFKNFEAYRDEKLKILRSKIVILHDSLADFTSKNTILYGKKDNSNFVLIASNISLEGTNAEFLFKNQKFSFILPTFGDFQAENILTLFAVASVLKIDFEKIISLSPQFYPEAGRSRIFHGQKNSLIVDGAYNGGFLSIIKGIESILPFANDKKIILFLGDMRELGTLTDEKHTELANKIIDLCDGKTENFSLCLVGESMGKFVFPIVSSKIHTFHTLSSQEAGNWLLEQISKESDGKYIIFAKGSQNTIFLEEGLKKIMHSEDYKFLCRQSEEWLSKKEKFFSQFSKS